jgi:hypothetical protein
MWHKAETRSKGQMAPLGLRCPRDDGQVGAAPLFAPSAANLGKGGLLPRPVSAARAEDLPHLDKRVTVGLKLHPMSTGAQGEFRSDRMDFCRRRFRESGNPEMRRTALAPGPRFRRDGAMTRVSLYGTRYSVSADR